MESEENKEMEENIINLNQRWDRSFLKLTFITFIKLCTSIIDVPHVNGRKIII